MQHLVVYTERLRVVENGKSIERIRLISARMATNFERGVFVCAHIGGYVERGKVNEMENLRI